MCTFYRSADAPTKRLYSTAKQALGNALEADWRSQAFVVQFGKRGLRVSAVELHTHLTQRSDVVVFESTVAKEQIPSA